MSALPYGSAFPTYGSALPFNPYPAAPSYSAMPSYSAAPIYDASSAYLSYPYATASFPSYAPVVSTPAAQSKPETVVVKKIVSHDESLEHYRKNVRANEQSVTAAYQELERAQVTLNQQQSEDYGRMFHTETQELVKYVQKMDSIKYQLSEPILAKANAANCFSNSIIPAAGQPSAAGAPPPAGAPSSAPQKRHPVLELKDLQFKVRDLRALLQKEVENL